MQFLLFNDLFFKVLIWFNPQVIDKLLTGALGELQIFTRLANCFMERNYNIALKSFEEKIGKKRSFYSKLFTGTINKDRLGLQ